MTAFKNSQMKQQNKYKNNIKFKNRRIKMQLVKIRKIMLNNSINTSLIIFNRGLSIYHWIMKYQLIRINCKNLNNNNKYCKKLALKTRIFRLNIMIQTIIIMTMIKMKMMGQFEIILNS